MSTYAIFKAGKIINMIAAADDKSAQLSLAVYGADAFAKIDDANRQEINSKWSVDSVTDTLNITVDSNLEILSDICIILEKAGFVIVKGII